MPTKRKRRTHNLRENISDSLLDFLSDSRLGYIADEQERNAWAILEPHSRLREVWNVARDLILSEWIQEFPTTRPNAWWEYDAPRASDALLHSWGWGPEAFQWDGDRRPAEPRLRVGGTGDPDYLHFGIVPHFSKGVPCGWVLNFDVLYYNGRARDVNNLPIGERYSEGDFEGIAVDRSNPPTFESEAEYLRRHDLLTSVELNYLDTHSELLLPEAVQIPEEDV